MGACQMLPSPKYLCATVLALLGFPSTRVSSCSLTTCLSCQLSISCRLPVARTSVCSCQQAHSALVRPHRSCNRYKIKKTRVRRREPVVCFASHHLPSSSRSTSLRPAPLGRITPKQSRHQFSLACTTQAQPLTLGTQIGAC